MFYFLPEKFVRMPFETVRAMKRARVTLYENDLKDGQEFEKYKEEYEQISRYQNHQETSLPNEIVKYVSRHFSDPKIANPDFKETYLTRLNFLLQFQRYVDLFERDEFSRENLIPLFM